jgi:hypothetical protein
MTTMLSANGLIEIPEVYRKADALKPGQRCDIERVGHGEYRVSAKDEHTEEPRKSWVDILLACPVKGWYEPLEGSETTDDLKPVRFE